MKQTTSTSNQSSSVSVAPQQPVSILRRSSTAGSNRKNNLSSTAASFNQSAHTIDTDYDDAPDGSFRSGGGDGNNSHLLDTPITDPDVLFGRILEFQRSSQSLLPAAAAADNNGGDDGKGMQRQRPATIRAGQPRPPPPQQQQRRQPPPPPPRSGSLKQKLGKAQNPSANNNPTSATNSEDEEEHAVRRLARIKLDGSDCSTPRDSMPKENPPPPPPPPPQLRFSIKKENDDEVDTNREFNESSASVNSNKFNSFSMSVTSSSKEAYTPRPVKVSQFEDKWQAKLNNQNNSNNNETSTTTSTTAALSKPRMAMASILSTAQSHVPAKLKNRMKKSMDRMPIETNLNGGDDDGGRSKSVDRGERQRRPRTHSMDRQRHLGDRGERNQRSRARSGDIDDDLHSSFHSSFSNSLEQPRLRRSKSVEDEQQQQRHLNDRQRRSRGRGGDRDNDLHDSFSSSNSSRQERPANAPEGNIYSPPQSRQHHRSRSREARRFPEKQKSISSDTEVRRKKNLGSNSFVRQDDKLNFDTKTGRCKKHPSIILAKKSKFRAGSWEVIKKNGCPFCARVEEDCDRDGCEQSLDEDMKRKMDMLLRDDRDNSGDTSSSQWSRNGEARKASSSRRASTGNSASLDQNVIDSIPAEGLRGSKVQRMLYTTPMGETGWYTGEVDVEGKPHGHGRMRYKTGHSYEGEWIHGYGEVHMENLNRMKAGFGTNKAAWKKSEMAPSVRKATTPDASKSSSSPSTRHHYQQQQSSNNQGYLSAQMQQQAHIQQVQMQHAQLQHAQMQQQQAQLHQAQMQQWVSMSPQERQMAMNHWYSSVGMSCQPGGYQMQGYPPI